MKIMEKYLLSKRGDNESCEDAIVMTHDFACVIDGTTSKSDRLWEGKKSGLMAATLVSDAIFSLPREVDRSRAIQILTSSIADYYHKANIYEELYRNPVERFNATIVLYSNFHHEIWMVGDCQCLIGNESHTNKLLIDDVMSNTRALYLEAELITGKTIEELMEFDTGREYIKPLLNKQALFQNPNNNLVYSYGVINGFEVPESAIKTVRVQEDASSLVLASDGYPNLKPTLEESEQALKVILAKDPLCMRLYKSTKGLEKGNASYDDRAYLKVAL
jgi:glycerophosphoryl diester phosphodiesterase